jgi:hypothetical protein
MEIYRSLHPPGSLMDEMEIESLWIAFERTYHIKLEKHWRSEISLGEMFALTQT